MATSAASRTDARRRRRGHRGSRRSGCATPGRHGLVHHVARVRPQARAHRREPSVALAYHHASTASPHPRSCSPRAAPPAVKQPDQEYLEFIGRPSHAVHGPAAAGGHSGIAGCRPTTPIAFRSMCRSSASVGSARPALRGRAGGARGTDVRGWRAGRPRSHPRGRAPAHTRHAPARAGVEAAAPARRFPRQRRLPGARARARDRGGRRSDPARGGTRAAATRRAPRRDARARLPGEAHRPRRASTRAGSRSRATARARSTHRTRARPSGRRANKTLLLLGNGFLGERKGLEGAQAGVH